MGAGETPDYVTQTCGLTTFFLLANPLTQFTESETKEKMEIFK
jgi:hypothetical protein